MSYIESNIVNEITIRAQNEILEIVESVVGTLKQKGQNHWALSPFKKEETPSFSVNPVKGIWYCFATSQGGNAVKFLMEINRWTWLETMNHLAERFGIDTTPSNQTDTERAQASRLSRIRALTTWAAQYFHNNLINKGSHVWEYLESRGYDLEDCKHLTLGLALEAWDDLKRAAEAEGYTTTDLVDAGLCAVSDTKRIYDRYRDRIIFPIRDDYGRVIAFAGRIYKPTKDAPKYINSPETVLYNKSEVLYNLDQARDFIIKEDKVILTEGYTDTLSLSNTGLGYVVATCGTALTPAQVAKLRRLTRNIILLRDGDEAGRKATLKDIDLCLSGDMDPVVLSLPDGMDPDDYIGQKGVEAFKSALSEAEEWYNYRIRIFEGDINIPKEKASLISDISDSIKKIEKTVLRSEVVKVVAERLGISEKDMNEEVKDKPLELNKKLTWENYLRLCSRLGVSPCEDFEKGETGGVMIRYKDFNDNPIKKTINGQSVEFTRDTLDGGNPQFGVYLPPQLRLNSSELCEDSGGKLFVVQDEIAASLLTSAGIPSVGISRPDGFAGGTGGNKSARYLSKLLQGFSRIIYMISGEAFALPPVKKVLDKPPYLNVDAGKYAKKYVKALSRLLTVFPNNRVWLIYPDHRAERNTQTQRWIESMLVDKTGFIDSVYDLIDFTEPDEEENVVSVEITNHTEKKFEELLKIDTAQNFFNFHGTQLGEVFKLLKYTYEVDFEGVVKQLKDDIEPDVFLKDDRYYGRQKGGIKAICNFRMECDLRIMGRGAFGIYTVRNADTPQTRQIIIKNEDFRNADKFSLRISEIPRLGTFSQATAPQLAALFQLICQGAPEATNLRAALGWYEANTEIDEQEAEVRTAFWVFGNGILNGRWRPADEKGLVTVDGETYFLPATSTIKEDPESHGRRYERQMDFIFQESDYSWEEWVKDMLYVHLGNGHKGIAFAIMAMYYDLIMSKMAKVPLMHFEGPPGVGKDELKASLSALWGKSIKWMDLQTAKITPAGYAAFFQQYSNALNIVNEYNPSSVDPARLDPIKSIYEGKLGEKKVGPHTNEMNSGKVTSATIIMGQEPIYDRKAIAHRCIHCKFEERIITPEQTARFNKLKAKEKKGLGQIFKLLAIHRDLVEEKFESKFELIMRRIKDDIKRPTSNTERLASNWSIMLSTLWLFIEEGIITYPYSFDWMIQNAVEEIEAQDKRMVKHGLLEIFFYEFIQTHYMQPTKYRLYHNHIFYIKDMQSYSWKEGDKDMSVPTPKGVITLNVSNTHAIFSTFLKDAGKKLENTSKSDLQRLLKKHPAFICSVPMEWIGYKTNERGDIINTARGPVKKRSSAYVFDAKLLKLDIDYTFSFEVDYDLPPDQAEVDEKAPVPF